MGRTRQGLQDEDTVLSEKAIREVLRVLRARQMANAADLRVRPNNPSKEDLAQWFGMFHGYKSSADMLEAALGPSKEAMKWEDLPNTRVNEQGMCVLEEDNGVPFRGKHGKLGRIKRGAGRGR
jgi:hypothetical protein